MEISPKKRKEKHISETMNNIKPNVIQPELLWYDCSNSSLTYYVSPPVSRQYDNQSKGIVIKLKPK